MLPLYLVDSLRTYKKDTTAFLTWLVNTGKRCGYEAASASTSGKPLPPRPSNENPTQSRNEPQNFIDTWHIVPLAESIASTNKKFSKVPMPIAEALQRAIKNRERCNVWFERHHGNNAEVKDDNEGHAHFLNLLKQALGTLENCILEQDNLKKGVKPSKKNVDANQQISTVINVFDHLTMDDILDREASQSRSKSSSESVSKSKSKPKTEPQEQRYTVKEAEDDRIMTIFCLLEDLAHLRAFIRETWEARKANTVSSIVAGLVTQTALDFAKALESDSFGACEEDCAWEKAVDLLKGKVSTSGGRKLQSPSLDVPLLELTKILTQFRDLASMEFNTYITQYVSNYRKSHSPASAKLTDPGDPGILTVLPIYRSLVETGGQPGHDLLTEGLRGILATQKIELCTVFALQVFLDIHCIMDDGVNFGLHRLQMTAKRMRKCAENYFRYHERMAPALDEEYMDSLKHLQMISTLQTEAPKAEENQAMFVLSNHPWVQGLNDGALSMGIYCAGVRLADHMSVVRASLHLYNTLLQTKGLKSPWPAMEETIKYFTPEKVFVGPRPTNMPDCERRGELAEGASLTMYAKDCRDTIFRKSSAPRRSMFEDNSLLDTLSSCFLLRPGHTERTPVTQDMVEAIIENCPTGKSNKSFKGKLRKQWDSSYKMGPVQLLILLRDAITEAEPRLSFDFFGAHRRGWRILRTLWSEFEKRILEWFPGFAHANNTAVDRAIHVLPLLMLKLRMSAPGPARNFGHDIMERSRQIVELVRAEEEREAGTDGKA